MARYLKGFGRTGPRTSDNAGLAAVTDYRIRVINTGLIVSWFAVAMFVLWVVVRTSADRTPLLVIATALVVALIVLTATPWRRTVESGIADWLITAWCLVALLAELVIDLRGGHAPFGVGFLLVPFFAAATAAIVPLIITVEIASLTAYWIALGESGGYLTATTGTSLLTFAAASVFVLLISVRVSSQIEESSAEYEQLATREAALARQEKELAQLYDVSLAIGAGTKLTEVLPDLIGRVAEAVSARVGLVMQYQPDSEELSLLSPIWVSGRNVTTDPFSVTLTEPGLSQRVFMSGDAAMLNDIDQDTTVDRLMAELGSDRAAAVSLRVEERTIGVLVVGDKTERFTEDDIRTLESLAAPASLVLNQMTRFEAVKASSERMAEVAQMKTDFVSVVSHELRTPLTSIIGALSTLRRPELKPPDERASQLIDMASNQANRLRTLIEDLLVMSRLEATSLPVRPVGIHLDTFLNDLLSTMRGADAVAVDIAEGTGPVSADPDHFARVITNLVENALKYGGDTEVAISAVRVGHDIRISVIDHGPGIPYEKHAVIFQRFTQLQPNATRSKGGAGLGLSIVKGLAEAMNGRVWFEPTVGGGATFTVSLPVHEAEDPHADGHEG